MVRKTGLLDKNFELLHAGLYTPGNLQLLRIFHAVWKDHSNEVRYWVGRYTSMPIIGQMN